MPRTDEMQRSIKCNAYTPQPPKTGRAIAESEDVPMFDVQPGNAKLVPVEGWPDKPMKDGSCARCPMTLTIHPDLIQGRDARRFRKYVPVAEADACWEWQSTRNKRTGYGKFWLQGKTVGAHRVSYMIWNGLIPAGQQVRHTCDNPPCVNPAHLITGTILDNARDALERDKYRRGIRNGRAKLTEEQVLEIRKRWRHRAETQVSMARRFGVSKSAIQWILNGKNWALLEDAS